MWKLSRFFSYIILGGKMNIKQVAKDNYKIFINKLFFKGSFDEKENIIDFVKDIILKKRKVLNLRGFYKVLVYVNKKIGMFIDMVKLEDSSYFNNLDLRVIVNNDSEVYFETEDYFFIADGKDIRYLDGKFYLLVDEFFQEKIENEEFGRFIYGEDVINVLANGVIL